MSNYKHERVIEYAPLENGETEITTRSYYERLAHMLVEREKKKLSTFNTLKQDVEETLSHIIDDGSPKMVLTIQRKQGGIEITKRYVTLKENFDKR